MEGFWTIRFSGVQGFGGGVITLIGGRVFGGDTAFLYMGTYTVAQNNLSANVHVSRHAPGMPSVMGQDKFDLTLSGTLNGNVINGTGAIPGTPLKLQGTLTKQADLPR